VFSLINKYLSANIRRAIENIDFDNIEEIRLRAEKPIILEKADGKMSLAYCPTQKEITETLESMSEQSIYAFLEEIKNGFLTLTGGHRVGICGRSIIKNGQITNITQVSGLNVRIAKEKKGIADAIINPDSFTQNCLIISPPNCGKTTLLRDIARLLGKTRKVGIIDERGEIAGMHKGIASYDVGVNSDCLDLCPKALGITMMVRSMSPEVIIVDEIGSREDIETIKLAVSCGVQIGATAQGGGVGNVRQRITRLDELFKSVITIRRKSGKFVYNKQYLKGAPAAAPPSPPAVRGRHLERDCNF